MSLPIRRLGMFMAVLTSLLLFTDLIAAPPNLNDIPSDLKVPAATDEVPAAGKRVRQWNPAFEGTDVFHVVYLPPDWRAGNKYPVIVEYPGNGGFQNKLGDRSTGRVEDCKLGYGISGGQGMIWLCLPFVDPQTRKHQLHWWGDPDATAAYCRETVARMCRDYGGDPDALILAGFSRGSLAGGYIGLRDDATAKLWRALILHSHHDGVRRWNYPDSDVAAAHRRLARLGNRPQFISHEGSVEDIRKYLQSAHYEGPAELLAIPYPNHSPDWVLKDIPERKKLRDWLADVLKEPSR